MKSLTKLKVILQRRCRGDEGRSKLVKYSSSSESISWFWPLFTLLENSRDNKISATPCTQHLHGRDNTEVFLIRKGPRWRPERKYDRKYPKDVKVYAHMATGHAWVTSKPLEQGFGQLGGGQGWTWTCHHWNVGFVWEVDSCYSVLQCGLEHHVGEGVLLIACQASRSQRKTIVMVAQGETFWEIVRNPACGVQNSPCVSAFQAQTISPAPWDPYSVDFHVILDLFSGEYSGRRFVTLQITMSTLGHHTLFQCLIFCAANFPISWHLTA